MALLAAALAAGLPGRGGAGEPPARAPDPAAGSGALPTERVVDVRPSEEQRVSDAPIEIPFQARADEELIGARIGIQLAAGGPAAEPLDLLVNDERVAHLSALDVRRGGIREVDVDPALLAPRNLLVVRSAEGAGACLAHGAPARVRAVRLALRSAPVPLPDDLAMLPLPFLDRGFDPAATIAVVIPGDPTPDRVRSAALVASWIALEAPVPVGFDAVRALPDGRALVVLDDPADAARLGIAPPRGPVVRMVDHPAHPGSNAKLLVVAGRNPAELRAAAERLASGDLPLAGAEVRLSPSPPAPAAGAYAAPRWLPAGRRVPFSRYPGVAALAHTGADPATLSVRFRIAPDTWIWPADFVVLDLGWSERIPAGSSPPRLDVDFNGEFLTTLPGARGDGVQRIRLRIPRDHVHGFNELRVHVRYPAPACAAAGASDPPRVSVSGDSVLHVEGLGHFAPQPDVSLFVHDGWPFTRRPDLSETAVVIPERPAEEELSVVLSVMARLAQVTGRCGTGAAFLSGSGSADGALAGRDLLLVGTPGDNGALGRLAPRLPIALERGAFRVRHPRGVLAAVDLLGGARPVLDARRAARVLASSHRVAAIAGVESPVTPGRTAIAITATGPSDLPPYGEFLGYAESRVRTDDLLVVADGTRSLFRIGPSFPSGRLGAWTRLRWFLANHWIVLVPAIAAAVWILARAMARSLAVRMRARLADGGGAP